MEITKYLKEEDLPGFLLPAHLYSDKRIGLFCKNYNNAKKIMGAFRQKNDILSTELPMFLAKLTYANKTRIEFDNGSIIHCMHSDSQACGLTLDAVAIHEEFDGSLIMPCFINAKHIVKFS